jgi:hypothetical protein
MFLMSVLLSVITLSPAMAPRAAMGPTEGFIRANAISPDATCQPGAICASATFTRNGCFFNNFWNSSEGGTPLTLDITQTGSNGSKVYVYWVNATSTAISIKKQAAAKYYCL